jgi:hypothetical protein
MFESDAHVGAEVLGLSYMKARPSPLRLFLFPLRTITWRCCPASSVPWLLAWACVLHADAGCCCACAHAQGEQPHCGFPEVQFLRNAERLVRHGARVVVVEQTETPEQLRMRNDARAPGVTKVQLPGVQEATLE